MKVIETLTNIADKLRNTTSIAYPLSLTDMASVAQSLVSVNLSPSVTNNWEKVTDKWNVSIAVIPVENGQQYSASLEIRNVTSGNAALMWAPMNEHYKYLDKNGNITSNLGSTLQILNGDAWSKDDKVHKGTFFANNCSFVELRVAGNQSISVEYRKLMINKGPIALPYTSAQISKSGGGN